MDYVPIFVPYVVFDMLTGKLVDGVYKSLRDARKNKKHISSPSRYIILTRVEICEPIVESV